MGTKEAVARNRTGFLILMFLDKTQLREEI